MPWHQIEVRLAPRPRGFHLITKEILAAVPELAKIRVGLAHIFILHTSASLLINENADPDVRGDLERWLSTVAPENAPYYQHTTEGPDDMPAHAKAAVLRDVRDDSHPRREARARYLAGHLSRRAPRFRRLAHRGGHPHGRMRRARPGGGG